MTDDSQPNPNDIRRQKIEKVNTFKELESKILNTDSSNMDTNKIMDKILMIYALKQLEPQTPPYPYPTDRTTTELINELREQVKSLANMNQELMMKYFEAEREHNRQLTEILMKQKDREIKEKEEDSNMAMESIRQDMIDRIDNVLSEVKKSSIPQDQADTVQESTGLLNRLKKDLQEYKDMKELFRELGELGGNVPEKKELSAEEIGKTINAIAEPAIQTLSTILGIAQEQGVKQPPRKNLSGGGQSPPNQTQHQTPKVVEPQPEPQSTQEIDVKFSEIKVEPDVALTDKERKEIYKKLTVREVQTDEGEKKELVFFPGGAVLADENGGIMTKQQMEYKYVTDPEFRKYIQEELKGGDKK